ncbi:MAG: methyltransferase regulatory domain-containing protein [Rhodopseudomonas sp.]|uniref:class I SAM-dependent methyltransferase n=1 Tax=Rhodopseudomonas sp. TaxID=1078 RepID=UPI0017DD60F0|nr:class I SAM-dependent methyltransferase [Rhodopseudomonas sp.]NVN88817.1 methyltransferase regulatory domain-containing protein [Rhodopseudomonas sp.]
MSEWTSGYVSEVDYTHGYYRELSPPLLSLALLNRGVNAGPSRPLRYLELGFGQGLSLNIHAAACPGEFWGTDFNPGQAANAKEMAEASGSGARIFDLSFEELAARDDLPEFDVIALHGIWSWISDQNRKVIVDLARRKLAVGGVLYISYNCTPGWSPAMPLRHLMTLQAELAGSDALGMTGKIDAALNFTQKVIDSGALYFRANPAVAERLKKIKDQNRQYLAHEYFNRDWLPMPFSQVAEYLGGAKLTFAASASLLDQVDEVCLTAEGRQLLGEIGHPLLRESVRDYFVSQQFRKDIFFKGPRPLSVLERFDRVRNLGFILVTPAAAVPMKLAGPIGEVTLQEPVYKPLLEIMAENGYAPKTVKQILAHPLWNQQPLPMLVQSLVVLTGAGHLYPVQEPELVKAAQPRCRKLNSYLCKRARDSNEIAFLASPVTGGGIPVARFAQLFLLARHSGKKQLGDWVTFAWELLSSQGQRLLKDGKAIESAEENIAELTAQAKVFSDTHLPILKALGIAHD